MVVGTLVGVGKVGWVRWVGPRERIVHLGCSLLGSLELLALFVASDQAALLRIIVIVVAGALIIHGVA